MPEYIILKRTSPTPPDDSSTSWNADWEQLPTAIQAVDRQAAVEAHLETLPEAERSQVFAAAEPCDGRTPAAARLGGRARRGPAPMTDERKPTPFIERQARRAQADMERKGLEAGRVTTAYIVVRGIRDDVDGTWYERSTLSRRFVGEYIRTNDERMLEAQPEFEARDEDGVWAQVYRPQQLDPEPVQAELAA